MIEYCIRKLNVGNAIMPLEAIAINDFKTPLIKEPRRADELKQRVQALYEQDKAYHDFHSGEEAIAYFQQAFANRQPNHHLYIGMFNDKPICALACFYNNNDNKKGDSDDKVIANLEQLAMHPENKNRGIEEQFIKLILQANNNNSYQFVSSNAKIAQIIKNLKNNAKN